MLAANHPQPRNSRPSQLSEVGPQMPTNHIAVRFLAIWQSKHPHRLGVQRSCGSPSLSSVRTRRLTPRSLPGMPGHSRNPACFRSRRKRNAVCWMLNIGECGIRWPLHTVGCNPGGGTVNFASASESPSTTRADKGAPQSGGSLRHAVRQRQIRMRLRSGVPSIACGDSVIKGHRKRSSMRILSRCVASAAGQRAASYRAIHLLPIPQVERRVHARTRILYNCTYDKARHRRRG